MAGTVVGRARGLALLARRKRAADPTRIAPIAAELDGVIQAAAAEIDRATGDPAFGADFTRLMTRNWARAVELDGDQTWVLTGDIPAMWLRDSAAAMRPYLLLSADCLPLRTTLEALVRNHWRLIAQDPRANAYTRHPGVTWHLLDKTGHPMVWERKYETDSIAFAIQLAWQLWRLTGSTEALAEVHAELPAALRIWRKERHHSRSPYRFTRPGASLPRKGRGADVGFTGMTWSAFRPSDDPCQYGYHVPDNLFAAHALDLVAQLAAGPMDDPSLADEALELAAHLREGVEAHGVLPSGIWAYEVDGLGGRLFADDANMPSLLSLPLCGAIPADDPRYLATRRAALSAANPWFRHGSVAQGIGSAHTPGNRVWPLALAVQGLTSTDRDERLRLARLLRETTGGTGDMHESFHADAPGEFSRGWFVWADSAYCELLLALAGRELPVR